MFAFCCVSGPVFFSLSFAAILVVELGFIRVIMLIDMFYLTGRLDPVSLHYLFCGRSRPLVLLGFTGGLVQLCVVSAAVLVLYLIFLFYFSSFSH